MKKLFIFAALFVFNSLPAFAGSFPDVAEDHVNFKAIEALDEAGVVDGYQDGTFGPENLVKRSEAAKIIVNAFKIGIDGDYKANFSDVSVDDWFFKFIMGAQFSGIINGYPDGTFKPDDQVNLAETLKMTVISSRVELPEKVEGNVFADVPGDIWFAPHSFYARNHNLVLSDNSGNLNAAKSMTRGEFAEVIYRMMVVMKNDGQPFPLHENWATYESLKLPFTIKYDDHEWEVIEDGNEVLFWNSDKEFSQFSPTRMYPNSAFVRVALDFNEAGAKVDSYFENIKSVFEGGEFTRFNFNGFSSMEVLFSNNRTVDWYIYLTDGTVLTVYTEFGSGALGYKLQQYIRAMISSLEYKRVTGEPPVDYSGLLSELFGNVLIEGKGMTMLEKLPDKLIIDTDAIGVGTGPIDYYYSEAVDYTFKYERQGDVILDKREGNTSSF